MHHGLDWTLAAAWILLRSASPMFRSYPDRKSTRLNSSHTEIYTLSLHDALPISASRSLRMVNASRPGLDSRSSMDPAAVGISNVSKLSRSEEHTSELQSHRDLHSFPTRRSSDLCVAQSADGECITAWIGLSQQHGSCCGRHLQCFEVI